MIPLLLSLAALSFQESPTEYSVPPTSCYQIEPFRLDTEHDGDAIRLAGDFRSAAEGPRPTILMITGSGDHVREQMISGVPMFGLIADALVRAGFNVVLSDPRGFGETTVNGESFEPPQWLQTPSSLRLADNRRLVAFLQSRADVSEVIVMGHSEGAMIASSLAADIQDIDLAILLSTSSLPGDEVFARQRTEFMVRNGVDRDRAEAIYPALLDYSRFVSGPTANDDAAFAVIVANMMAAQSGLDEPFYDGEFLEFFRSGTAWHREFMGYDPAADLARIQVPVLAFYGAADDATPPQGHVPALMAALAEAGNTDVALHILPDQDHFFLEFDGVRVDRHPYGRTRISNELISTLLDALRRRYGDHGYCGG
jgi:uncharacterized protein